MRAVLQRVKSASVTVENQIVASIGSGMVILLGVQHNDTKKDSEFLARKCAHLRIFDDAAGKMNLSALDVGAEFLVVSQFTLYGDCKKGRRPSFTEAARTKFSEKLYRFFTDYLRQTALPVAEGIFGAKMLVEIKNDGPVTLIIDSPPEKKDTEG